jgi:hypothetical protein
MWPITMSQRTSYDTYHNKILSIFYQCVTMQLEIHYKYNIENLKGWGDEHLFVSLISLVLFAWGLIVDASLASLNVLHQLQYLNIKIVRLNIPLKI